MVEPNYVIKNQVGGFLPFLPGFKLHFTFAAKMPLEEARQKKPGSVFPPFAWL
jgi:hypothetical protein